MSAAAPALEPAQLARVTAFALLLWISGAVLIRLTIPLGVFSGGGLTVLAFAVGVAINPPTIWLVRRLGGLRCHRGGCGERGARLCPKGEKVALGRAGGGPDGAKD
eukprot:gene47530-58228_t